MSVSGFLAEIDRMNLEIRRLSLVAPWRGEQATQRSRSLNPLDIVTRLWPFTAASTGLGAMMNKRSAVTLPVCKR